MGQRTITTVPVLSVIRIEPATTPTADPRVWVEGQVQDEAGNVVEQVQENVYPALGAAAKARVQDILDAGLGVVRRAAGD